MSIHQKISQFLAEPMDTANGHATALSSEKISSTDSAAKDLSFSAS
jgi:hypothetical protein